MPPTSRAGSHTGRLIFSVVVIPSPHGGHRSPHPHPRGHISCPGIGRGGGKELSSAAGLAADRMFSGCFSKKDVSIYQLFIYSSWAIPNKATFTIKR